MVGVGFAIPTLCWGVRIAEPPPGAVRGRRHTAWFFEGLSPSLSAPAHATSGPSAHPCLISTRTITKLVLSNRRSNDGRHWHPPRRGTCAASPARSSPRSSSSVSKRICDRALTQQGGCPVERTPLAVDELLNFECQFLSSFSAPQSRNVATGSGGSSRPNRSNAPNSPVAQPTQSIGHSRRRSPPALWELLGRTLSLLLWTRDLNDSGQPTAE